MTNSDKSRFFAFILPIIFADDDGGQNLRKSAFYTQHGDTSVLLHSIMVAYEAWKYIHKNDIECDERSLLRGALLHDYFLYDWHKSSHGLHGYRHPFIALKNASRDYKLNDTERMIISRHMFPLTPLPPLCREAFIVCLADKICSTKETLNRHRPYRAFIPAPKFER